MVTTAMLALYTGKGVAPGVNLRECISHTPLPSANKAEPTLALKPRGDITKLRFAIWRQPL